MTLPKMTWSISSGAKRARARAPFDARTPSSIAPTPVSAPLYSAMGVRTPSAMTGEPISLLSQSAGAVFGGPRPPASLRNRERGLVEAAPEGVHVDRARVRVEAGRQEDEDAPPLRIDEKGPAGEARVPEGARRQHGARGTLPRGEL